MMGKKVAIVGNAERMNQGVGNVWEISVDRVGTGVPHGTEGIDVFTQDDGKVCAVYFLRWEDAASCAGECRREGIAQK